MRWYPTLHEARVHLDRERNAAKVAQKVLGPRSIMRVVLVGGFPEGKVVEEFPAIEPSGMTVTDPTPDDEYLKWRNKKLYEQGLATEDGYTLAPPAGEDWDSCQ